LLKNMCGRVIQSSEPFRLAIVEGPDVSDSQMSNVRPRYNAAPSQELLVIRENHKTGERSLDLIRWGVIRHRCADPKGGRSPINAKAEAIATLPMFSDAYARRRCIVPVDGFFEWRAVGGARAKQPYAIAMKDESRAIRCRFRCQTASPKRPGERRAVDEEHEGQVPRAL
jgi:putative SOS response-associated peptidase YedK